MRLRPALAAALLALALPHAARAASQRAFVFGTDYTTGTVSFADLGTRIERCDAALVNSDASLRFHGGLLWVVNRFGGDNVQAVDPATGATVRQFTVGAGSNPHDIAFASDTKAYVSRFDQSDLWIVNPETGAHTGTIPLAGLADSDGLPEMDRMAMVGPLLFVALERVDRNHFYAPNDTSLVAVIDTRADTLVDCDPARAGVQAIALRLRNPFTDFQRDPATGGLVIGCVGAFYAADGGVERIDPVALRSDTVLVSEAALGGDLVGLAWGDSLKSWAIVAPASGDTRLVTWRAATGAVLDTLWTPGGYVLTDVERNDRGEVWACDASLASPALRVFSAATDLPLGPDLTCTLPPVAVAFDDGSLPPAGGGESGLRLGAFGPNPASTRTTLAFALPVGAHVRLEVLDLLGRHVRTLADGDLAPGPAAYTWDLADEHGRRVPQGLYAARLTVGGVSASRSVIVLR